MEEYSTKLKSLKEEFIARYEQSRDKETLLQKEIEFINLIFENKQLPFPVKFYDTDIQVREIILQIALKISLDDLREIRSAYSLYVIDGREIPKIDDLDKNPQREENLKQKEKLERHIRNANLAVAYFDYLQWLNQFSPDEEINKRRFPVKYYAWCHKILIAIEKADPFDQGDKKAIQALGKNKYGCGPTSGFYQHFIDFNLARKEDFVNSLGRDRKKWKDIIKAISDKDIDVIRYLDKFPN